MRSYRAQLTQGEEVIDPTTWAGSVPHVNGIAPRVRVGRGRWFNLLWLLPIGFVMLIFIIRSGVQILSDHPRLCWTRHSTPGRDWFRIQKPVPTDPLWTAKQDSIGLHGQVGLPGLRHSIGLARWWHLGVVQLIAYFITVFESAGDSPSLNGVIFFVLLL